MRTLIFSLLSIMLATSGASAHSRNVRHQSHGSERAAGTVGPGTSVQGFGIYRPCPASVTFANGRNGCLGLNN